MASDVGSGTGPAPGWPFGGVISAVQDTMGDLYTELTSFTKFRDRVDELLEDLKASPADARKLGEDRVAPSEFGDPAWAEANGLYGSYKTVITELENLSKMLSHSIEGMGIAVLAAHKGYENLDEDVRHRMLAISDSTKKHYGGEYVPEPPAGQGTPPPTAKPTPEASTGNY
ncbi:hypothetical protein [Streptomyces fulvorobeus]|uniref:Uncharacterized protein n=1 Tax=Streptomyces fulvorobeus TaxID=284028 RepID=A0A7J0C4I0_9ACTN|nr:hypothetical protein [Streptomyces fulvorobeus]NYE41093.1 hypothetical protein [Streptomyces fulvorobeus]GFM97421.1 hypothetical protein Sfulv_22320 [Streptomyces fulvorobeus]